MLSNNIVNKLLPMKSFEHLGVSLLQKPLYETSYRNSDNFSTLSILSIL